MLQVFFFELLKIMLFSCYCDTSGAINSRYIHVFHIFHASGHPASRDNTRLPRLYHTQLRCLSKKYFFKYFPKFFSELFSENPPKLQRNIQPFITNPLLPPTNYKLEILHYNCQGLANEERLYEFAEALSKIEGASCIGEIKIRYQDLQVSIESQYSQCIMRMPRRVK